MREKQRQVRRGFTLIEVLVAIAAIAILIAILLPSLSEAREGAKRVACASNLCQISTAIHAYAHQFQGYIPRGPDPAGPYDFSCSRIATNQIWIGDGGGGDDDHGPPAPHPRQYNGLGPLLVTTCPEPQVCYCPSDDRHALGSEAPRIGTGEDAYASYIYRQLDHLPPMAVRGRLDQLGTNQIGNARVNVEALAMDLNSLGPDSYHQANHDARRVNVLFRDGSVQGFSNIDNCLAIPPEAFGNPADIPTAVDQLFTNADYAYRTGKPQAAPRVSGS